MKKLCLGLFPNMKIDKVQDSLPAILRECADDGIAVQLPPEWARAFGTDAWTGGTPAIDVAVSLGGDGTFLRMARCMVEKDIPVFGINFGHLGFLAEVDADCARAALQALSRGHLKEERRHLLQLRVSAPTAGRRGIPFWPSMSLWRRGITCPPSIISPCGLTTSRRVPMLPTG